jgi:Matrixin
MTHRFRVTLLHRARGERENSGHGTPARIGASGRDSITVIRAVRRGRMAYSRFSTPRAAFMAVPVVGALLWAGQARAFCREVTAYPPTGYDPVDAGCFVSQPDGGPLFPLFWRNQCVSYSFQKQGSQYVSPADASRIAAQAFSAWSSAPCPGGAPSISAIPFPAVDCDGTQGSQEHNNLIIFRDGAWDHNDAANVIGYTTLTVDLSTGEILGANIEINSHDFTVVTDLADASAPRPGTSLVVDLGTVLTHEAGHFLGLAHSADLGAVMYAHYKPGSTTLTPDDVSGICSVYSPTGMHLTSEGPAASTTCEPTPREGFLSSQCGSIDAGTAGFVGSGSSNQSAANADPPCTDPGCAMGPAPLRARVAAPAVFAWFALVVLARRTQQRRRLGRRDGR